MSLPEGFTSIQEYLSEALLFLKDYQWLYNYQNTHILVENILEQIPSEWKDYFLNCSQEERLRFPFETQENTPQSLVEFVTQIQRLTPNFQITPRESKLKLAHNSGLSKKKLQEIIGLAPLVHEVCQGLGLNKIVDVGAGLGYLSHCLHQSYGFEVVGIEGDSQKVKLAYLNQKKFYANSEGQVKFIHHFIGDDSVNKLEKLLDKDSCVIGLHACADLSITILEIFKKIELLRGLVIIPCCYHRIEGDDEGSFKFFPVSTIFKGKFLEFEARTFIQRPFLRLACQGTAKSYQEAKFEERKELAANLLFRAILQQVAEAQGCQVRRLKRKTGAKKNGNFGKESDFEEFLKSLGNNHKLECGSGLEIGDDTFTKALWQKWHCNKANVGLVELLTSLQTAIQSICENLVLLDRIAFLREHNFECFVEKVVDDRLSPRCFALVALKQ